MIVTVKFKDGTERIFKDAVCIEQYEDVDVKGDNPLKCIMIDCHTSLLNDAGGTTPIMMGQGVVESYIESIEVKL